MKFPEAFKPRALLHLFAGVAIILACLFAGVWIKKSLHLFVPGNAIGMLILLGLLVTKVVKVAWIDTASKVLLFMLPMMFLPIYVHAASDRQTWQDWGLTLFIIVPIGVVVQWAVVGCFSQWFIQKRYP
jgi:holin-like protein